MFGKAEPAAAAAGPAAGTGDASLWSAHPAIGGALNLSLAHMHCLVSM